MIVCPWNKTHILSKIVVTGDGKRQCNAQIVYILCIRHSNSLRNPHPFLKCKNNVGIKHVSKWEKQHSLKYYSKNKLVNQMVILVAIWKFQDVVHDALLAGAWPIRKICTCTHNHMYHFVSSSIMACENHFHVHCYMSNSVKRIFSHIPSLFIWLANKNPISLCVLCGCFCFFHVARRWSRWFAGKDLIVVVNTLEMNRLIWIRSSELNLLVDKEHEKKTQPKSMEKSAQQMDKHLLYCQRARWRYYKQ